VTSQPIGSKPLCVNDEEAGGTASGPASDRRSAERVEVEWAVDCGTDETFLYASIRNISEMGIFVQTLHPLEVGTRLTLRFAPPGLQEPFVLHGVVQWVNPVRALAVSPNPGMGIRFVDLTLDERERLVEAIHTIAYVGDTPQN